MRPGAASLLAAALIACSSQGAQPSPSAAPNAQSPAADLRVQLDLLLAEHVMILAKESEAAVYRSDEYGSYTTLLGASSADLSALVGRGLGPTAATQFAQLWNVQNGYLVDYTIGMVTHDGDKAANAMTGLHSDFQPRLGKLFNGIAIGDQLNADKAFIDDLVAQNYGAFYRDLHIAYASSQRVGDSMTDQLVARFPDRFPGRVSDTDVSRRVAMNVLLQEHSYLSTMATDSAVAKRDVERTAAISALATNAGLLEIVWRDWDTAMVGYAAGGPLVVVPIPHKLATAAPKTAVQHLVDATLRVIDDQKAGSTKTLANDDRAAATAMQPIADSL